MFQKLAICHQWYTPHIRAQQVWTSVSNCFFSFLTAWTISISGKWAHPILWFTNNNDWDCQETTCTGLCDAPYLIILSAWKSLSLSLIFLSQYVFLLLPKNVNNLYQNQSLYNKELDGIKVLNNHTRFGFYYFFFNNHNCTCSSRH